MTVLNGSRKSVRAAEAAGPGLERVDGVWHVRDAALVRQVLRAKDATTQAGFTAESSGRSGLRQPILFLDGAEHRRQRSSIARFFAPKVVSTRYRDLMARFADDLLASAGPRIELDRLAMRYSVAVAAEVIGLTHAPTDRLAGRLERLFDQPAYDHHAAGGGRSRFARLAAPLSGLLPLIPFHLRDVRPACRARRQQPAEDVISHLIAEGYKDHEILIECVTYGAAGMVTTREFISMATWHLLGDEPLRQRYLVAGEPERLAILAEILRLEPIVGHLYRRATEDIDLPGGTIETGDLIDLYLRAANADEAVVGDEPMSLCPGRTLPPGFQGEVLSFGDGAHKCPGNSLALAETDALLTRLLALDLRVVREPTIGWDELISGYSLRGFVLAVG